MQKKGRSAAGFTLIELLVVIAIIAILAGILFPVFLTAKRSALRTKCMNNMKQLGTAFQSYKNDWGGYFPLGGFRFPSSDYSSEWQNSVYRYVKSDAVYRCPGCQMPQIDWTKPTDTGSESQRPRTAISYLYNTYLGADVHSAAQNQAAPKSHHESEVIKPTKCILLMEGNIGRPASSFNGTDAHGRRSLWLAEYTFLLSAANVTGGDASDKSYGLPYHAEGGNIAFSDGHCTYKSYTSSATLQASLPWLRYVPTYSDTLGIPIDSIKWGK